MKDFFNMAMFIIPQYKIDPTFNETNQENVRESIDYYNGIFGDCLQWVPHTDEASTMLSLKIRASQHRKIC